jgi:hypothetical protein
MARFKMSSMPVLLSMADIFASRCTQLTQLALSQKLIDNMSAAHIRLRLGNNFGDVESNMKIHGIFPNLWLSHLRF